MIYHIPRVINDIIQGDICQNLPKILPEPFIPQIDNAWKKFFDSLKSNELLSEPISFKCQPIRVTGIVLNQSCDIRSGNNLLFAEIREVPITLSPTAKKRTNQIKKIVRDETRSHFLPSDNKISFFSKPKIIDFTSLFFIPFDFLMQGINQFFIARLITNAQKVFAEKISRFFTRLAFEDLMFLTDEEIKSCINEDDMNLDEANNILSTLNRTSIK